MGSETLTCTDPCASPAHDCFYRVSAKALVWDATRTKFLTIQEQDGYWDFPGGGVDHGEDPRLALPREIKEEMGIAMTRVAEQSSYFLTFKAKPESKHWRANVFYETELASLDFTPSPECIAMKFVAPEEVFEMEKAAPNVRALAEMLKNIPPPQPSQPKHRTP